MHSRYLTFRRAVPPKEKQEVSKDSNYTKREKLFVCPKCRIVWELVCETGHVPEHLEKYPVLPRYGKPMKDCPDCGESKI